MPCLQLEGICSPLLPAAVPYAAEDLHTHCTAIHDRSLLLSPWEPGGSVDTQALCQRPDHPMAVPPVPRITLLSPFQPHLPGAVAGKGGDCRCSWRAVAQLAGAQPAGRVPAGARHACWCVLTVLLRATRSAPDWCWACVTLCHAADQADPDAPSLCYESWTVAVPGGLSGHLASSLRLGVTLSPPSWSVRLRRMGVSLCTPSLLPAVTWALLSSPFPCARASLWDTGVGGWLGGAQVR